MSADLLGALLFGGALAVTCALLGVLIGGSVSGASHFHPGRLRRWLRRFFLAAVGAMIAAAIVFALPSHTLTGMFTWLVAFAAFVLGYRFASGRRMLRALDSGIAVGLH
jgi:uncharacterized membrane protein YfcA